MTAPNVLLVTADQWPSSLLGIAGREDIDTPTIDQIARNGMGFTNAHSEFPNRIPARRSLMTGTGPRSHGDRIFQPAPTRTALPHLAEVFRGAGYQTGAVGKLHVCPARDRIGFEEVVPYEEGRPQPGGPDDWNLWLSDDGPAGQGCAHGMSNNGYEFRPWHLAEEHHPTVWQAHQMCRTIQRREPTRPPFWRLSFNFPHPPIVPLASYLAMCAGREMRRAVRGAWSEDLPPALERVRNSWPPLSKARLAAMRRAYFARCTLIGHQLRLVIATTDMLGDHGLFAKRVMLDASARVPLLLTGTAACGRTLPGKVDDRLCGMRDIMPTLLDVAGIGLPATCTGRSLVGDPPREALYCGALEGQAAMRMVTDGRLIGCAPEAVEAGPNRGLSGQRGLHYPEPPPVDPAKVVGAPR